jgi:hypothetical protein
MPHAPDQDLILLADRDLDPLRAADVWRHLATCTSCRARLTEVEEAIAGYSRAYHDRPLPPSARPRALLLAQLQQRSRQQSSTAFGFALAACAVLVVLVSAQFIIRGPGDLSEPRNTLTPGETRAITVSDVCRAESGTPIVPVSLQQKVFQEYGIAAARPNTYEVDYLITPELGGANSIRNLWPEPYSTVWNAHVKDALEDRLHDLVCQGKVDLPTAQREIATDWIGAYKKYFHTSRPLQSPG